MCEKRPYQSPVVQARPGFDPEACTPEQWAALLWCLNTAAVWRDLSEDKLIEDLCEQVKITPTRISADEPRTGDMIEDANGRRYWFVSAKPERLVSDAKIWGMLCREPGMRTYLGGVPS